MLKDKIEKLKKELGEDVKLVAVTKNIDIETLKKAKESGIICFGENKESSIIAQIILNSFD